MGITNISKPKLVVIPKSLESTWFFYFAGLLPLILICMVPTGGIGNKTDQVTSEVQADQEAASFSGNYKAGSFPKGRDIIGNYFLYTYKYPSSPPISLINLTN